jgi:uncharacterized Zn finger protein
MARKRSSYYDSYWPRYTPPIDVKDGIKAKSQRGKFVKNWWADRWIRTLSNLMDAGRLSRGRSYARRGQVISIDVQPGYVSARVQGSRRSPYRVGIQLAPLDDRQWERVLDALAEQAIFAAQLLNGEMPIDIEQVFAAVQVPLFPAARGDLATECSCPDWVNPCKHIAAVYYLLGERFDEDPFLLFKLRGRDKEQVASALRERRGQGLETAEPRFDLPDELEAVVAPPLETCLADYWTLGNSAAQVTLHVAGPKVDMALIKRLGVPDFMDAQAFWVQMERVYTGVTAKALTVAFAEKDTDG